MANREELRADFVFTTSRNLPTPRVFCVRGVVRSGVKGAIGRRVIIELTELEAQRMLFGLSQFVDGIDGETNILGPGVKS